MRIYFVLKLHNNNNNDDVSFEKWGKFMPLCVFESALRHIINMNDESYISNIIVIKFIDIYWNDSFEKYKFICHIYTDQWLDDLWRSNWHDDVCVCVCVSNINFI